MMTIIIAYINKDYSNDIPDLAGFKHGQNPPHTFGGSRNL